MRILFVSNGNFKHLGERSHMFESRIRNGFIRNQHHVYFLSDRDTVREKGLFRKFFGHSHLRHNFLTIVKNFKPDLIMLGQADYLTLQDLMDAKSIVPDVKIAAYCIDIVFCKHIEQTIVSKLPALDAVFCTTAGTAIKNRFKRDHVTVSYIPNPCDISIDYLRCETMSHQPNDIFWAMRGTRDSYDNDPRFGIARTLSKNPNIDIDYYGYDGKPILLGRNYYDAMAGCRGGLNISVSRLNETENHNSDDIYLYSSDRIAHYFGCGLLVYILKGFGLEEILTENHHAVYFDNVDDLTDKILYYKKHDDMRIKIASQGADFYRTHFNEQEVARYITEITFFGKPQTPFGWHTDIY